VFCVGPCTWYAEESRRQTQSWGWPILSIADCDAAFRSLPLFSEMTEKD